MVRLALLVVAACSRPTAALGVDSQQTGDAEMPATTTLVELTAANTSASPLFVDDYRNYNTTAQTGNSNGDLVPRAISKVSLSTLVTSSQLFVETQTWFCHLAANEAGSRLVANARCGSHIDVGYNSDDPAQVARTVADIQSRGLTGAIMDWSGRDASVAVYPTATTTDHTHARGSTEVGTNAVYGMKAAAEAAGTQFAVMEDEGITHCRKGESGGCACWPAYGTTCNETSQVISDLAYIRDHWATSPAYLRVGGKPIVLFFAPDYNACPDPNKSPCLTIDWTAVQHLIGDQVWIFEGKSGYAHAFSGGAFNWLGTTAYPGTDTSFGKNGVADYDAFATTAGNVKSSQHIVASAFKGFDDGVTDGWFYADGSHTRYIGQRCGQTWLATLAQVQHDFAQGNEILQLPTWDDYEEASELETGIDTCVTSVDASVTGSLLTWSVSYHEDLTGAASGTEATIDHVVIWSATNDQLTELATLSRDANGDLPHTVDVGDATTVYVQLVGKPFLANAMSKAIAVR